MEWNVEVKAGWCGDTSYEMFRESCSVKPNRCCCVWGELHATAVTVTVAWRRVHVRQTVRFGADDWETRRRRKTF